MSRRNLAKIQELNKDFRPLVLELLQQLEEAFDEAPLITDGNRTLEEQKALYAKGRTAPGKIVTWTLNSNHIGGNAIDIGFLDEKGKLTYNVDWDLFGTVVASIPGLDWGFAMWGIDKPHVQFNAKTAKSFGKRPKDYKEKMAKAQKEVNRVRALMAYMKRIAKFFNPRG